MKAYDCKTCGKQCNVPNYDRNGDCNDCFNRLVGKALHAEFMSYCPSGREKKFGERYRNKET